jgi:hypothetical protein
LQIFFKQRVYKMQELIDHQLHHSGFVVIAPQVNYMPALISPTDTPSPPNNNWMSVSPNLCSIHSSYERQFISDTNTYTFPSHMNTISPPLQQKPSIGHNYFQSEPESLSNQSEPQSITPTLITSNKSAAKKK